MVVCKSDNECSIVWINLVQQILFSIVKLKILETSDVDEPVVVVDDGAAVHPDVEGSAIVMDALDVVPVAGLEMDLLQGALF